MYFIDKQLQYNRNLFRKTNLTLIVIFVERNKFYDSDISHFKYIIRTRIK